MQAMQKRLKELQEVYGLLGGCEVRLKAACKAQDVLLVSQVLQERDKLYHLWQAVFIACQDELKHLAALNAANHMQ